MKGHQERSCRKIQMKEHFCTNFGILITQCRRFLFQLFTSYALLADKMGKTTKNVFHTFKN